MTKEEYLETHKNAYEWTDGTIDVTLSIKDSRPFSELIKGVNCPLCDNGQFDIPPLNDTIYGAKLKCKTCGQNWFIHKYVVNGGTPSSII